MGSHIFALAITVHCSAAWAIAEQTKNCCRVYKVSFLSALLYCMLPHYACACAPFVPQAMHQASLKPIFQPESAVIAGHNYRIYAVWPPRTSCCG